MVATSTPPGFIRTEEGEETRIRPHDFGFEGAATLGGSIVAAVCLAWLLYYGLTPLQGGLGFWLLSYALFLLIYWLTTRERLGRLAATDRLMTAILASAALAMAVTLMLVLGYVVLKGWPALQPHFFTQTLQFVGPLSKSTSGGAEHAIVGTFEQVGLAMVMSVPLGVLTAIFLNEIGGPLARPVRMIVDAMSATPSIVAGLFIYALWILALGNHQSGFAAALALSVLMLPTVARTAEVVFRLVPGAYGKPRSRWAVPNGAWCAWSSSPRRAVA